MTGPFHDFLSLSLDEYAFSDYVHFLRHPEALKLSDDLIWYFNDTLKWIPTINPARKNEPHLGLCMYGPTVIHTEGAEVAKSVFEGWANLLSNGPDTLNLSGLWNADEGEYLTLVVERDGLVFRLRQLSDFASRILESDGKHFILHLGV